MAKNHCSRLREEEKRKDKKPFQTFEGLEANLRRKGTIGTKVLAQSSFHHLIVHQRVEPLPVTLDLGGDVLVLEHDPGNPALTPLWGGGRGRWCRSP